MAVVINEFEVVPESTSPQTQAAATSPEAQASAGVTAHEMKLIMLKLAERCARIRAH